MQIKHRPRRYPVLPRELFLFSSALTVSCHRQLCFSSPSPSPFRFSAWSPQPISLVHYPSPQGADVWIFFDYDNFVQIFLHRIFTGSSTYCSSWRLLSCCQPSQAVLMMTKCEGYPSRVFTRQRDEPLHRHLFTPDRKCWLIFSLWVILSAVSLYPWDVLSFHRGIGFIAIRNRIKDLFFFAVPSGIQDRYFTCILHIFFSRSQFPLSPTSAYKTTTQELSE